MKTPRELLLQRHQTAAPKLDAIRRGVTDDLSEHGAGATVTEHVARITFFQRAWFELFWSCRRAWLGVGAAWFVMLLVNLSLDDTPDAGRDRLALAPSPETRRLWREQRLLRAELMESPLAKPTDAPAIAPRPRSEWRREQMIG